MKDLITNLFLAGLGAMALTKEKAEEVVAELIQKGEVNRDEAKAVVDSLVEKGKKEKANVMELVRCEVRKVIEDMGVPSRAEFEELKKKLEGMEKK
jgi:polyhydroxyalkanoate synthesis regulator phasin